jgi:cellulose synthase/poly-beta-1,6-N-acetylglucosamine synthase-like glycosyltransferase
MPTDIDMWIALSLATLLFFYPFVIYPLILWRLARRNSGDAEPRLAPQSLPSVALIICALNEQKIIRQKMENCLALRYPRHKLSIVVVSDGSTDATADIVLEYQGSGIQLIEQPVRQGKIANLNAVLPTRSEEILVLSDANVIYHPDALWRLAEGFQDPGVGCVSGKVILTDSAPELDQPTSSYYSIEWLLQEQSSWIYSMVGADGAMYALRRELFRPCPNDTLVEDFIIPMSIVRQGRRTIFAPKALGWERGPASLREEFRRKVRISAGCVQGLVRGNGWPGNAPLRFWFIFISHKLLRWLSPVIGLMILVLSSFSIGQPVSQVLAAGFALMSVLALLRLLTGWAHPLVSAPFYFLFGQIALGWGLLKGIAKQQPILWAKADR